MLKDEFEKLYGNEVSQSVYTQLEHIYMSNEMSKREFVQYVKHTGIVESIYKILLDVAETKLLNITEYVDMAAKTAKNYYDNKSTIALQKDYYTPNTMISVSVRNMHVHNRALMSLAICNQMNTISEML